MPEISRADTQSKTILPTGRLMLDGKDVLQEVEVLRHRPMDGLPVGFTKEWVHLEPTFIKAIVDALG